MANRCISRTPQRPHVCSPLSAEANAEGKLRLVLNLRHLNQFLQKVKFKYEDLRVALLMLTKEDFLIKFYLKSSYHHLDIYEPHRKYLGFSWGPGEDFSYFVFNVLPFGLATACYAFAKLMCPLVSFWKGGGLRVALYLDDGMIAIKGEERAKSESERIQADLLRAGLVINYAKSCFTPTKQLLWLGFQLDLERGQLTVPHKKLDLLKEQIAKAVDGRELPAMALASVIGKILSMSLALGPVTCLMTRGMYTVLNARASWFQQVLLTSDACEELTFWLRHISALNGQNLWPDPSAVRVVYSDANGTGYGSYCVEHGGHITTRRWRGDKAQSSTWREFRAVHMTLDFFGPRLKNHRVRWFTDNQNVVRIVLYGSRKPLLQKEALAILSIGLHHQICLEPEWIPQEENEFADYLS